MKNVLVIGGSYFVGRVFVEELSRIPDYAIYVMNRGNVPINIEGVIEIICDRHDAEAMYKAWLLDSVPPLVKTTSSGWQFSITATCFLAFSMASLASMPNS